MERCWSDCGSWHDRRKLAGASASSPGAADLDCELGCAQPETFRCDGAGLTVIYKTKEIAGELYRVKPAVRTPSEDVLTEAASIA